MESSQKRTLKVLLTGAAGQIGYSIVFMIGNGDAFGPDFNVHLVMLDLEVCKNVMEGVKLELEDCAFPNLVKIDVVTCQEEAFKDIDVAILVAGAIALGAGMKRSDLLVGNRKIYEKQALLLDKYAKQDVKVIMIANPANTNCAILADLCKRIPRENFTCLTRLDHNRAVAMIARKFNTCPTLVKKVVVWGNHSSSMVPDHNHAAVTTENGQEFLVRDRPEVDEKWVNEEFIPEIKERAAAVIALRQKSSALSAAKATCDHLKNWFNSTPEGDWVSMGVPSDGSYGIAPGIIYSFPCTTKNGTYKIVQGLDLTDKVKAAMVETEQELVEEKKLALS